jgi:pimeloyl-ACP methyl ester carboxylesterase
MRHSLLDRLSSALPCAALGPLLVLAAACSQPPGFDPCLEIDCSGHGRCTLVSSAGAERTATCLCDSGYLPSASGWLCLAEQDTSLCAGISCSGHGRCASVAGTARCVCDEDFELGESGLTCEDPCAGVNCGLGGSCSRAGGVASCSCPTGTRPTLDQLRCEAGPGPYAVYAFTLDANPGWVLGRATLDFSGAADKRLIETTRVSFGFDYYGRGYHRTSRQVWTLDAAGDVPVTATIDDLLTQGKIQRRRRIDYALSDSQSGAHAFQATLQRGDKTVTVSGEATQNPPLPMLGAFEYPGWTLGCFSPAFYMLLLRQVDAEQSGEQQIAVFHPSTGVVSSVRVEVDVAASKPEALVLDLKDEQVRVTYQDDLPATIRFASNEWTWTLEPDGAPIDSNLTPAPTATAAPAPTLPTVEEAPRSLTGAANTLLAATFARPTGSPAPASLPAILLVSGPFAADRDHPDQTLPRSPLYQHLAAHLAAAGYATLRYDPRGRGQSQGDAATATTSQHVADAQAALAALASEGAVDPTRVYVLASGWNTPTALPLLGGTTPVAGYLGLAPIAGTIEDALVYARTEHLAASGFSKTLLKNQRDGVRKTLGEIAAGSYAQPNYGGISKALIAELLPFDGLPTLTAFAGPALLLRGDQDLECDPAQLTLASDAATAAAKTNLTTKTLSGLTYHGSAGSRGDLWESSVLPLEVSPTLLTELSGWLASN